MKYTKKEETNKKSVLTECFTLWDNESKNNVKYLSGSIKEGPRVIGFYNKKDNEKQPSIKIYAVDENGKKEDKELITLWDTISKNDKKYLSGYTNENESIVAYYQEKTNDKQPIIKGYFKNQE